MLDIEAAVRDGVARKLRVAAHTLKGMVAFFAAESATAAAAALEWFGERGDLSGAEDVVQLLSKEITSLAPALNSLLRPRRAGFRPSRIDLQLFAECSGGQVRSSGMGVKTVRFG
jgi:chemotaxis protein histidine kinase CheA